MSLELTVLCVGNVEERDLRWLFQCFEEKVPQELYGTKSCVRGRLTVGSLVPFQPEEVIFFFFF